MTDLSVILTAHREKLLIGPALASLEEAVAEARTAGLSVEILIVLDRPDPMTRAVVEAVLDRGYRLVINDGGDPGLTRNRGVQEARGDYVAFLDGDDLISFNWLTAGYAFCRAHGDEVIAHSEVNVIFGEERAFWFHADSTSPDFDAGYQRIGNHWDAMSLARRSIYERIPFVKNQISDGLGHEDWHWNNLTLEAGYHHRPVPGTVHMKRRRPGSQMAMCALNDVVVRPTDMTPYTWNAPRS
jgi:glycosyltransferase involved in cell wall biosynthesis